MALSDGTGADWIIEAVRLLFARGASVNAADDGGTSALHYAIDCAGVAPDLVQEFLDLGANPHAVSNWGQTTLMRAGGKQHLVAVEPLLAQGCDVNAIDQYGRTALFCSVDGGVTDDHARRRPAVVARLLDAGAEPVGEDRLRGQTMLMAAAGAQLLDLVGDASTLVPTRTPRTITA